LATTVCFCCCLFCQSMTYCWLLQHLEQMEIVLKQATVWQLLNGLTNSYNLTNLYSSLVLFHHIFKNEVYAVFCRYQWSGAISWCDVVAINWPNHTSNCDPSLICTTRYWQMVFVYNSDRLFWAMLMCQRIICKDQSYIVYLLTAANSHIDSCCRSSCSSTLTPFVKLHFVRLFNLS